MRDGDLCEAAQSSGDQPDPGRIGATAFPCHGECGRSCTSAEYCPSSENLFGSSTCRTCTSACPVRRTRTRLRWLVTTARSIINPSFIVATGDLTDSTNGGVLGIPNGPWQAEWDEYKEILIRTRMPERTSSTIFPAITTRIATGTSPTTSRTLFKAGDRTDPGVVDAHFPVREVPLSRREQCGQRRAGVQHLFAVWRLRRTRLDGTRVHQLGIVSQCRCQAYAGLRTPSCHRHGHVRRHVAFLRPSSVHPASTTTWRPRTTTATPTRTPSGCSTATATPGS